MRILITGAAGFLGSHLVDRFLDDGHTVIGLDNLSTGRRENLEHLEGVEGFRFINGDITWPTRTDERLSAVLHFASPASPVAFEHYQVEILDAGGTGTRNALDLARDHDARFLLASTSEVYGDPKVHPQMEEYTGNVDPVGPRSAYDEAKRYAEALTMAYHRVHGLNTHIARIFNTYGPRMNPEDGRVVPNMIMRAIRGESLPVYGTGQQTRSFCHVDDLVEGIVRLLFADYPHPVNLGNPDERTILDLAATIAEEAGTAPGLSFHPLPPGDPLMRRPDVSRARRVLMWEPRIGLREGIRRTVPYFRGLVGG